MEAFVINGAKKLEGEVTLYGAKNSALPILTASLLIKGTSVIHNCPDLTDVRNTLDILTGLGCKVSYNGETAVIDSTVVDINTISRFQTKKMRSSILFLGALLGRLKSGEIYLPGGCKIGERPIDLHLDSLSRLGADIICDGEKLSFFANKLEGEEIKLDFPSVGATENIMIAAVLSSSTTTIINAAREPEISDLADFLNKAGARVRGAGEYVIKIEGVKSLHSVEHTVIPDRILASTYMSICASAKGSILIKNVRLSHLTPIIPVFYSLGCRMNTGADILQIISKHRPKSVGNITTKPYPYFPTDSQPMLSAVLCTAKGKSSITESIFENRFIYANGLKALGADVYEKDNTLYINGVKRLYGARVKATDLRGAAALVTAALGAKGRTVIENIAYIDRGYESLEKGLSSLGADIKRFEYEEGYKEN
ncbi:MAG: UDP-N-acetylglucosamine 1-carboxyvinyltransferase [Eubacterium sp.]|nr:UDP-N-acetylglucosamine 1-carboxyvinyltransferase [Eubacterium sp.]